MDHSASNTTSLFSLFGKLGVFILLGVASSRPAQAESIAVPHQNKICKLISHNFACVHSASYSTYFNSVSSKNCHLLFVKLAFR